MNSVFAIAIAAVFHAALASSRAEGDSADKHRRVTLDLYINWDYPNRRPLQAWNRTADIIESTLRAWFPQIQVHARLENASAFRLEKFFEQLPGPDKSELSFVYLASRQSPAGEWEFTQGPVRSLPDLLRSANVPEHNRRITILDSCFAGSLQQHDEWLASLGRWCLYAAAADEFTWELDFRKRLPIDMKRRFPAATDYCENSLGRAWNGQISFLGFVWVEAFLQTRDPPTSSEEWAEFFARCEKIAERFFEKISRRRGSHVLFRRAL